MLVKKVMNGIMVLAVILVTTSASYAQQYNNGYYYYPPANNYNYVNQPYQQPQYNQAQNYGYQPVADPYYNQYYTQNYNPQPYYSYQPTYDPGYTNSTRMEKVKKALTYGAIGAGAGYIFSKKGSRTKNTAIGAGLGAALGLLTNQY